MYNQRWSPIIQTKANRWKMEVLMLVSWENWSILQPFIKNSSHWKAKTHRLCTSSMDTLNISLKLGEKEILLSKKDEKEQKMMFSKVYLQNNLYTDQIPAISLIENAARDIQNATLKNRWMVKKQILKITSTTMKKSPRNSSCPSIPACLTERLRMAIIW